MKTKALKDRLLQIRVSEHEYQKAAAYAEQHGTSVSHVIREYIRRLPNYHRSDALPENA